MKSYVEGKNAERERKIEVESVKKKIGKQRRVVGFGTESRMKQGDKEG